jgi:hypothetical protein
MPGADVGGWGSGSNLGRSREGSFTHGIVGVTSQEQVAAFMVGLPSELEPRSR